MGSKEVPIRLPAAKFRGLDLRTDFLSADKNAGRIVSNVLKDRHGRLSCRPGVQHVTRARQDESNQILYPFTHTYFDVDTLAQQEELGYLLIESDGASVQEASVVIPLTTYFALTYTGANTATFVFEPHPTTDGSWRVTVTDNGSTVFQQTYADGFNSVTNTVATLVTALDALANFTCVVSPTSTSTLTPIDALGPYHSVTLTVGSPEYTIPLLSTTTTYGAATPSVEFTEAGAVLPSFQDYSNVMYVAFGDYLYKYDGHLFYRAGMMQGTINAIADAAAGTTFNIGETYIYKIVQERRDNRGNIIEGEDSDDSLDVATHTMSANRDILLTIDTAFGQGFTNSDFAFRSAYVNGNQNNVTTITVDNTVTLQVGDTAYFYDNDSGAYVTREITDRTATTITIDGAAVDVLDNQVISNNLRTQIWRTTNGGTDFFLVEEIPTDTLATTQAYTDSTADDDLGEQFQEQTRKHTLPPKCTYVGTHQGLLVLAGDPENPLRVAWNLPDGPEGFPIESNFTDMRTGGTGALTGFKTVDGNTLAVFKKTAHALIVGDLDALTLRTVDKTYSGIGCTSFRTLDHIGGDKESAALVGLSLKGPFVFNQGEASLLFSESIEPLFPGTEYEQVNGEEIGSLTRDATLLSLTPNRAVGINDYLSKHYHLFIPAETGTPLGLKYPSYLYSKWLVYDYGSATRGWYEINYGDRYPASGSATVRSFNAAGGFTMHKGTLYFGGLHNFGVGSTDLRADLMKFKSTEDIYDYMDGARTINCVIHYLPFARQDEDDSAFFKPLYVGMSRYITPDDEDGSVASVEDDYGDFSVTLRTIHNYQHTVLNATRTFDIENDTKEISCKIPSTHKTRVCQVRVSNGSALRPEVMSFDEIEFTYSTPFDRKKKEPHK